MLIGRRGRRRLPLCGLILIWFVLFLSSFFGLGLAGLIVVVDSASSR